MQDTGVLQARNQYDEPVMNHRLSPFVTGTIGPIPDHTQTNFYRNQTSPNCLQSQPVTNQTVEIQVEKPNQYIRLSKKPSPGLLRSYKLPGFDSVRMIRLSLSWVSLEQRDTHDWSDTGFPMWLPIVWLAGRSFRLLFGLSMF
jgi:hypothetical protein